MFLIVIFIISLLYINFLYYEKNENNTYYEKFLRINNEIKNNEYNHIAIGKETDSKIINKTLQLPKDKAYNDERSVYIFTKKYSLEDKNNNM